MGTGRRRSLSFALLAVMVACAAAAPAAVARVKLGLSIKSFAPFPSNDAALEAVAPSLDTFLTSLRWRNVQGTCRDIRLERYDWRRLDRAMGKLAALDLPVTGVLKHGPRCSSVGGVSRNRPRSRYMAAWIRFARKIAARYGPRGYHPAHPLRALEVWSEPNLHTWPGGPRHYGRVFVRLSRQISRADRAVRLVVGGPGYCCDPRRYIAALYDVRGFRRAADLIGVHTYSRTPTHAMRRLRSTRAVIRRQGARTPITITEHGWSTCPRPSGRNQGKCVAPLRQARYMARYVRRVRRSTLRIAAFYWFTPQDFATPRSVSACPRSPKDFYGFYTQAGKAKRSRQAWQRLTGVPLPSQIPPNPITRGCQGPWR